MAVYATWRAAMETTRQSTASMGSRRRRRSTSPKDRSPSKWRSWYDHRSPGVLPKIHRGITALLKSTSRAESDHLFNHERITGERRAIGCDGAYNHNTDGHSFTYILLVREVVRKHLLHLSLVCSIGILGSIFSLEDFGNGTQKVSDPATDVCMYPPTFFQALRIA